MDIFAFVCHGRVGRVILQCVLPLRTADTAVAHNKFTDC